MRRGLSTPNFLCARRCPSETRRLQLYACIFFACILYLGACIWRCPLETPATHPVVAAALTNRPPLSELHSGGHAPFVLRPQWPLFACPVYCDHFMIVKEKYQASCQNAKNPDSCIPCFGACDPASDGIPTRLVAAEFVPRMDAPPLIMQNIVLIFLFNYRNSFRNCRVAIFFFALAFPEVPDDVFFFSTKYFAQSPRAHKRRSISSANQCFPPYPLPQSPHCGEIPAQVALLEGFYSPFFAVSFSPLLTKRGGLHSQKA